VTIHVRVAPCHFISYRRRDSIYAVDRPDERLKQAFGADAVFHDVGSIRKGQSFAALIRASLHEYRGSPTRRLSTWPKCKRHPNLSKKHATLLPFVGCPQRILSSC
jgi:hypothetical protein